MPSPGWRKRSVTCAVWICRACGSRTSNRSRVGWSPSAARRCSSWTIARSAGGLAPRSWTTPPSTWPAPSTLWPPVTWSQRATATARRCSAGRRRRPSPTPAEATSASAFLLGDRWRRERRLSLLGFFHRWHRGSGSGRPHVFHLRGRRRGGRFRRGAERRFGRRGGRSCRRGGRCPSLPGHGVTFHGLDHLVSHLLLALGVHGVRQLGDDVAADLVGGAAGPFASLVLQRLDAPNDGRSYEEASEELTHVVPFPLCWSVWQRCSNLLSNDTHRR